MGRQPLCVWAYCNRHCGDGSACDSPAGAVPVSAAVTVPVNQRKQSTGFASRLPAVTVIVDAAGHLRDSCGRLPWLLPVRVRTEFVCQQFVQRILTRCTGAAGVSVGQ